VITINYGGNFSKRSKTPSGNYITMKKVNVEEGALGCSRDVNLKLF
jgi:hypothetical protein